MDIKIVKKLDPQELDQIVKLHQKALSESFINNFGKNFIKNSYKTSLESSGNIFLIISENNKILGYLLATENSHNFNTYIVQKNFFTLIPTILKALVKKPLLVA